MMESIERLTLDYKKRGILTDTNLLLLYFVGKFDVGLIGGKRTKQYCVEDFDILCRYLDLFDRHVTTPNVLTETSNLVFSLVGTRSHHFFNNIFSKFVDVVEERYVPSRTLTDDVALPLLGLTDCGIMKGLQGEYLLLTDDLALSNNFNAIGGDSINFNHIRMLGW
jgi:hypothetical protein